MPAVDSPCDATLSESVNKIFQVMFLAFYTSYLDDASEWFFANILILLMG